MQSDFEQAQDEWDQVAEIVPAVQQPQQDQQDRQQINREAYKETPLVTIEEVLNDFRSRYLENLIQTEDEAISLRDSRNFRLSRLRTFLQCPSGFCQPLLRGHLQTEKTEVMAMSRCVFDDSNPLHFAVLLTLYKQLTNDKLDCPRYGSHWETIGFQGNDPSTDLRGVGFLGLAQALYFAMTPELVPLARSIFRLSQHETQNFPLLVLSINVTRIALQSLRDGQLDRFCVQENSVWSATNYFYVSVMFHIYKVWKDEHKTIRDSGYVLKSAEIFCRGKVKQSISNLNRHIISDYSIQEKQQERVNIQNRIKK